MQKQKKDFKIVKAKLPKGYSVRVWEIIGNDIFIYCEPEMKWELVKWGIEKPCKKKK